MGQCLLARSIMLGGVISSLSYVRSIAWGAKGCVLLRVAITLCVDNTCFFLSRISHLVARKNGRHWLYQGPDIFAAGSTTYRCKEPRRTGNQARQYALEQERPRVQHSCRWNGGDASSGRESGLRLMAKQESSPVDDTVPELAVVLRRSLELAGEKSLINPCDVSGGSNAQEDAPAVANCTRKEADDVMCAMPLNQLFRGVGPCFNSRSAGAYYPKVANGGNRRRRRRDGSDRAWGGCGDSSGDSHLFRWFLVPGDALMAQIVRIRSGVVSDPNRWCTANQDFFLLRLSILLVVEGMVRHARRKKTADAVVHPFGELVDRCFVEQNAREGCLEAVADGVAQLTSDGLLPGSAVIGAGVRSESGQTCWQAFCVGDSRTYLLCYGELDQISVDRSANLQRSEEPTYLRVLTRAAGTGIAQPQLDQWWLHRAEGSRILCCSDGLTDDVLDQLIRAILLCVDDSQQDAGGLVESANRAGGRDNIAAVVVACHSAGIGSPVPRTMMSHHRASGAHPDPVEAGVP